MIYKEHVINELSKINKNYALDFYDNIIEDNKLLIQINDRLIKLVNNKHKTNLITEQITFFSNLPVIKRINNCCDNGKNTFFINNLKYNYNISRLDKNFFNAYFEELSYLKYYNEQILVKIDNVVNVFWHKFSGFFNELFSANFITVFDSFLANILALPKKVNPNYSKYNNNDSKFSFEESYNAAINSLNTCINLQQKIDMVFKEMSYKNYFEYKTLDKFLNIDLEKIDYRIMSDEETPVEKVEKLKPIVKRLFINYKKISSVEKVEIETYEKIYINDFQSLSANEVFYLIKMILEDFQTAVENCHKRLNYSKTKVFTEHLNLFYKKVYQLKNGESLNDNIESLSDIYYMFQSLRRVAIFEKEIINDIHNAKFSLNQKNHDGSYNNNYSYLLKNMLIAQGIKDEITGEVRNGIPNCYKFLSECIDKIEFNDDYSYFQYNFIDFSIKIIIKDAREYSFFNAKGVVKRGIASEVLFNNFNNNYDQFMRECKDYILKKLKNMRYMLKMVIMKDFVYNLTQDVNDYYLNYYSTGNRLLNICAEMGNAYNLMQQRKGAVYVNNN